MNETIRIRFVASRGAAARVIRCAQLGYRYTHVDVEVSEGWLGARLDGGVAVRPRGYDASRLAGERLVSIDVSDAIAERFHGYLRRQLGKDYDHAAIDDFAWSALTGEGSARPAGAWRDPARWFCSELVAAALVEASVLPTEIADEAHHITPQCLAIALAAVRRADEPG